LMAHTRGHAMAKAAIENALWDADAKRQQLPLWKLLGGAFREISCGVSIGIQDSVEQLLEKIETELAAGYQRIKVKVKPGWRESRQFVDELDWRRQIENMIPPPIEK